MLLYYKEVRVPYFAKKLSMNGNVEQEQVIFEQSKNNMEPPQGFPQGRKKIISLIIGIIVVVVIVILIIAVVLPGLRPKEPEEVSLTYWGLWEDPSVFSQVISDFRRTHPNIHIIYEKQDIKGLGKYVERLSTRIKNRTGPDIFRFHNSWVPQIKDLLLPLPQDVVEESELENKYYEVVKRDLKRGGAYYGIPLHIDTLALFVNNEILRVGGISSYPSTWDDIVTLARRLTVKDESQNIKTAGVALGTFDNVAHAGDIISLLFIQNGADLKNLAGPAVKSAEDTLEFYVSFARGESRVWDETQDGSKLAFAKGNLALYFGYSWDVFEIKALNPNLSFTVVPVPHLPNRNETIASYWVEGVSSGSKHTREAFEFLKFLSKKETLEKLYTEQAKIREFGELYPRADMADLFSDNPLLHTFVKQGEFARSTIFSSDTYDDAMNATLNSYLGNAVRGVLNNNTSPQTAIKTLSQGVEQVMGRFGQ